MRSVGITIFGSAIIIASVLLLSFFIISIISVNKGFYLTHFVEVLYVVVFIALGTSGIFIIRKKNWARILFLCLMWTWFVLITYINYIILRYHPVPVSKETTLTSILFQYFLYGVVPFLISVYYLTRLGVKEQFKQGATCHYGKNRISATKV